MDAQKPFGGFLFCLDLILQPTCPPGPSRGWLLSTPKLTVSTLPSSLRVAPTVWVLGGIQIPASVQLQSEDLFE